LHDEVAEEMGTPVECEHPDAVTGDTLQRTTVGLAFYRKSTNTPTFTNGSTHWALTPDGLATWTGESIDPPVVIRSATTLISTTPGFALEAPAERSYASETTNWGVQPQSTLKSNVGSRTPIGLPGARVVATSDIVRAFQSGTSFLMIDALWDRHDKTIQGAIRIPDAGLPGTFDDPVQQALEVQLRDLTGSDLDTAIVFFCQGAQCWESYNATLRAANLGYTNLYWYRGGLAAWTEAGLPLSP